MVEIYEEILKLKKNGKEGVLVCVVDKEGHGPSSTGAKMLVLPDGSRLGTVGGGPLEEIAVKKAEEVLKERKNSLQKYTLSEDNDAKEGEPSGMVCGGNVTLFFEYIKPGVRLYIFGAGHIGKALIYHLKKLNYHITVIDNRKDAVFGIEGADRIITGDYREVLSEEEIPKGGFFVVTTHTHQFDSVVLNRICQFHCNPRYIGLVASRKKAEAIVRGITGELAKKEINFDILYTPVGLDIGGKTPDEIAISIISEIQSVRFNKGGNHLRVKFHNEQI